jgi:hypothetical protein
MRDKEILERDRKALSHLFGRLDNLSREEYNALVHAIWAIDRDLREVK